MKNEIEIHESQNKFGRLTIQSFFHIGKRKIAKCLCDCGTEKDIRFDSIQRGFTTSCGCYAKEQTSIHASTHGLSRTRLHNIWFYMKSRCYNPNHSSYGNYGGRNIRVCDEWRNSSIAFMNWALANGYADNLEIDRIDNSGNYEPSNCRWVTRKENSRNMRRTIIVEYRGVSLCLKDWASVYGLSYKALQHRYKQNYRGEDLFAPVDRWATRRRMGV